MIDIETLRTRIESANFAAAQSVVLRLIRRSFRIGVYRYAQHNSIVDFGNALVEQQHRDFEARAVANAQAKAIDAQTATTISELLIIFDSISDRL